MGDLIKAALINSATRAINTHKVPPPLPGHPTHPPTRPPTHPPTLTNRPDSVIGPHVVGVHGEGTAVPVPLWLAVAVVDAVPVWVLVIVIVALIVEVIELVRVPLWLDDALVLAVRVAE